jgi:lipopolysaccharide export system protein LptA
MSFVKAMRITVAVLLGLVLVSIVGYFLIRLQKEDRVPVKTEKVTRQTIEKREKPDHSEFKGNEKILNVKADEQFIGEDNNYHAEGNVEMIFFKEREGQDVFLYGGRVIYDKDMTWFESTNQAKAKFKDLVVESILLNFDNKKEILRTDKGVLIISRRLTGSAQKMDYWMEQKKLSLQGEVRLQIEPKNKDSSLLIVRGKRLDYDEISQQGKIEGDVQLFYGESRASAEIMEFELFPDGEQIKTLILKKNAWALLEAEGEGGGEEESRSSQGKSLLFARSVRREIEGKEIRLRFFQEISGLQEVEAIGNSSFKFISSTGEFTRVQAESSQFTFDREGELIEFQALKNARIVKQAEDPDETRRIEGDSLIKKKDSDLLWIKGRGLDDARLSSQGSDVFAGEMTISLDTNDLEVEDGVKVILKSKTGGDRPIGIFSKELPVFVQAKEMRYFAEQKRFLFNGDTKAWQEKKVLQSEEIELFDETGKLLCEGGVKSTMPHTTKEGKEEKLKISSEKMAYFPEENLVVYQRESTLAVQDAILRAQSISVYLGEEDKGIQKIVGKKKVVITQNMGEAFGEEAIYDPEKESLVLLGNPVFIDKDRGRTEGHKLTFYMADGRILVENQERERSLTVIKRER